VGPEPLVGQIMAAPGSDMRIRLPPPLLHLVEVRCKELIMARRGY
jgi:hypothetical protein